jgi:hypothetical protein
MDQNLAQHGIDELRKQFMGKRVSIEDGNGRIWIGNLNFIGYNSFFPNWGLCATLDRLPIQGVKVNSIYLKPLTKSIFDGKQ